jgi:hypothetical protein
MICSSAADTAIILPQCHATTFLVTDDGGRPMNAIVQSSKGLSLLISVNWDRIIFLAMIFAALGAGAWVGSH